MEFFQSLAAVRIVFIFGIINFILFLLLFFSCRCPVAGIGRTWMKSETYQKYFRFHCYLWWFLLASVIIHMIFAILVFGIPF